MIKSIKAYLDIPILSLSTGRKLGSVKDFVVSPTSGVIVGVIMGKKRFFTNKSKVISSLDIREISPKALIIDSEDVVVEQDEILDINKIIKKDIKIINSKVYNKKGKYIGKVFDYLIDDFFHLYALSIFPPVYSILSDQLIIPSDRIIKIKKNAIIIDDDNQSKIKETEIMGVAS